jgi:hypothetical protein
VNLTIHPDNIPKLFTRQYRIAERYIKDTDDIVKKWITDGRVVVAPNGCRINSPLLSVPKKDDQTGLWSKTRVCLDVRKLNSYLLEDDKFEIPRIPDMLATLAGGKIFGEIDLSDAYGQFRVSPESQQYTAFSWNKQQYVFVGAPFGIKHLPSLFQRYISNLFYDMPYVFCYIDNICFASTSWEEHTKHAKTIVDRLNSVNLRAKPTSVNFGQYQIKLLGHVITPYGVGMDPMKQKEMLEWPPPTLGSGIASFLGLGTFLRDHIRHYAELTAPLEKIKNTTTPIEWTPLLTQQFNAIKRAFSTAPFLKFPDFNKRFAVATDASQTGVGGVLYQPDDDDDTITANNIVAIVSKQLTQSQQRYPVYKKELWGLVYCLRKFHTFIHGRKAVNVHTDHKPLIHIFKQTNLATALQQWLDVILDYDLVIKYRPGVMNVLPDALSRMYMTAYTDTKQIWGTHSNIQIMEEFNKYSTPSDVLCIESINDAKPIKVIKKRHIVHGEIMLLNYETLYQHADINAMDICMNNNNNNNNNNTVSNQSMDEANIHLISALDHAEFNTAITDAPLYNAASTPLTYQYYPHDLELASLDWTTIQCEDSDNNDNNNNHHNITLCPLSIEDRLIIAQEQRGKELPDIIKQKELLLRAHEAGHYGEKAIYKHIEQDGYWWPNMRIHIQDIIKSCTECQKHTITKSGYAPAKSIYAARPSDHYQIDLAQFPTSIEGWKFCLVCIDVFTGYIMLEPIIDKSASSIARALWKICCIIGIPKILQSDNGSEFSNKIVNSLCRLTGIPRRFIAPYNPRADGKVERSIKTIKQTLIKLLHGTSALWPLYIPFIQLMYNNKVSELTGSTPFSLMFGRKLNELTDYSVTPYQPVDMNEWKDHQDKVVSLVYPAINDKVKGVQAAYIKRLDKIRKKVIKDELVPGTVVQIKDPLYLINPSTKPFKEPTYIGPYTIIRRSLYGPYILRDDTGQVYGRQVPIDQMKIVYSPNIIAPEEKVDAIENDIFEVDYIMDHRDIDGEFKYYVKWKGYDKDESTWVKQEDINDPQPIERYFKLLLNKRPIKSNKRK